MTNETTQKFYYPSEEVVKNAAVSGMEAYKALCAEAEQDYEGFWGRRAKELIDWQTPFTQVLDESNAPFFKWFADGKLNVSYNCLDRNVERGLGDKTAIIFEADGGEVTRVTYSELLAKTCQIANGLKSLGIGVHRDELDAAYSGVDHPAYRIGAAASAADDLDYRQVCGLHHSVPNLCFELKPPEVAACRPASGLPRLPELRKLRST